MTENKEAHLDTPYYEYDLDLLQETLNSLNKQSKTYGYHIHYALKANANDPILAMIRHEGLGADCVSGNEVKKAMEIGFEADKIVFAGVGKTDQEILTALSANIFCFNCESIQEIEVINELATKENKKASIALRINPNVNANTHHYITTGLEENKFGINLWELEAVMDRMRGFKAVQLIGLHFHIGSQITDLTPFRNLCNRVNEINQWFLERNILIQHLNLGGGLGIDYKNPSTHAIPDFKAFFDLFHQFLQLHKGQEVHFELGRSIVANCGSLLSRVVYVKKGVKTKFVILDAGMTELLRPALYQAYHKIENISSKSTELEFYDVVGPICESSDCFGKRVPLPITQRGDIIKIHSAGAYGEVMASRYNLRELPRAVYKSSGEIERIKS